MAEGEVPSALPGLRELFAICYRTQWQWLGLTHPDLLFSQSLRMRPPLPLTAAHANILDLLDHKPRNDDLPADFKRLKDPALYTLNVARMALAQLARGTRLQGAPPHTYALYEQLAYKLEADPDLERIEQDYARDVDQQPPPEPNQQNPPPRLEPLPPFVASVLLEDIEKIERDTPDARFFTTFAHQSLRLLNGRNSTPPELRNYAVSHSYQDRVVDTTASVDVKRPVEQLFGIVDPCKWNTNLPTLWPEPTIFINGVPIDRRGAVTQCAPPASGTPGPFFEFAQFAWGVMPVTAYRNVLNVTLHDERAAAPPSFGFSYCERSCLVSDFFGLSAHAGGIDVDHGYASATQLTGGESEFSRFTSRKASRFDIPKDPLLNRMYNDIAAIGLSLLIEAFTLFGAVAPTPPAA